MSALFRKTRHTAPESPPSTSRHTSNERPKQKRRHSDTAKSDTSHRPNLFKSKTWHISVGSKKNLAADEPSPKLPKTPRTPKLKSFFTTKSEIESDADDSDYDFSCRGEEGTGMLVGDANSSKHGRSRKTVYVNAPVPVPSRSKRSASASQTRGEDLTRKSRAPSKPVIPSRRSRSEDPSALRTTETSSAFLSTKSRSPYGNSSAPSSFLNPRSISSVHNQREAGKTGLQAGSSNGGSDAEETYRGRDARNDRRERSRNTAAQHSDDGSSEPRQNVKPRSSSHNHRPQEEKKKQRHGNRTFFNDSDYHEERDYDSYTSGSEHRLPPKKAGNTSYSARRAAVSEGGNRNKPLPKIPVEVLQSHSYDNHIDRSTPRQIENNRSKTGSRRADYYGRYERAH